MTRKDYKLIAETLLYAKSNAIISGRGNGLYEGINFAAQELARAFATANDQFDAERFLAACGTKQEQIV